MDSSLSSLLLLLQNAARQTQTPVQKIPHNPLNALTSLLNLLPRAQGLIPQQESSPPTSVSSLNSSESPEPQKKQKRSETGVNMFLDETSRGGSAFTKFTPTRDLSNGGHDIPHQPFEAQKEGIEAGRGKVMNQLPTFNLELETKISGQIRLVPSFTTMQLLNNLKNQQQLSLLPLKLQLLQSANSNRIQQLLQGPAQKNSIVEEIQQGCMGNNSILQNVNQIQNKENGQNRTGIQSLMGPGDRQQLLEMLELEQSKTAVPKTSADMIIKQKAVPKKVAIALKSKNKSRKRRQSKKVWIVESLESMTFKEFHREVELIFEGEKINEERTLKLLEKSGWNKLKVSENIKKNKLYYKRFLDGLTGL